MIKEIKYNGYTANPSDYECADGDLALTMGLVQENGAMKPILPPTNVCYFDANIKVLFAQGTLAVIEAATRRGPDTPQSVYTPRHTSGRTISFKRAVR